MIDYIRDGQAIYRQSFATIRAEANLAGIPADLEKLAVRVIHACGMVDVVDDLRFSPGAGAAVGAAESKEMLAADSRGVPYVIVRGRRGGSAMAAAAVNALATERE
ncbi:precorrin-8X methylmutase [Pseudomonas aeruginosa]|uniref:precorrin-8X methylmutase n=1 Tax=Pseudomonas aeruginosa TaxID=287 RepID=UPI0039EB544A